MTDYKNLKLIATSNPHIRSSETTRSIMLDVIIAMLPALIWSVVEFGFRAITVTAVSVAGCVFFEWLYRKLLHKPQMIGALSAAVTGLLQSMVCPPELPVWMLVIGNFFSIFVVKQLYGGRGNNFLNPALAARAALVACYASAMTSWSKVDAVTGATPMALLKAGDMEALTAAYPIKDMAIGFISGSAGEVSALMLLIGGVYLIVRKVISWQTPVAYIATVAVVTFLFPRGNDPMTFMLYNVLGGGLFLGAFFMATDYVTSPVTKKGQLIFGLGCGLITVFIRYFGSYPEGVCYSILIMNCCTWIIDKYTKPTRFGVDKKKEGAAK